VKGGRLPLDRPKRMRPELFASAFWHWWMSLNAPARTSSSMGRLLPGAHGDTIQIGALRAPGKNGWLVILYALLVWREWIGDGKMDDWNAAVADVRWVTIQLCDSLYYNASAKVPSAAKRYTFFPSYQLIRLTLHLL
jgi:hypothetical protein